jgi:tetratricopeptide (TPR) repeat protein
MKPIRVLLMVFALGLISLMQPDNADIYAGTISPEDSYRFEDMSLNELFYHSWCNGQLDCEQAIKDVLDEVQKQSESAELHYQLGVAYFKYGHSGNWNKGVEAFKKAIEMNPNYAEAYCKLGEAYNQIHYYALVHEHPPEEREAFLKAIEINPNLAEAYVQLGDSYLIDNGRVGDCKRAEELFNKAIEVAPEYAQAYHALARAYLLQERQSEALEATKKALLVDPAKPESYAALYEYGSSYRQQQDVIETFKEAIRLKPDIPSAYRFLGLMYSHHARYDEAIQAYKELLRISPYQVEAHYELGAVYVRSGDRQSAMAEYIILKRLAKKTWDSPFKNHHYQRRATQLLDGIENGDILYSHYGSCTP